MTSPYVAADVKAFSGNMQEILSGLPLNTSNFKVAALDKLGDAVKWSTTSAGADITQNEIDTSVRYVTMTDTMAQMNEALNANVYITTSLASEFDRVTKLDESAKKDIHKVRQRFMAVSFLNENYKFLTNVAMFTLVVTLILLSLTAAWRMNKVPDVLYYILCGVVIALYTGSMFVMFRHAAARRNYQWNKYYWRADGNVKRAIDDSNASNDGSCA